MFNRVQWNMHCLGSRGQLKLEKIFKISTHEEHFFYIVLMVSQWYKNYLTSRIFGKCWRCGKCCVGKLEALYSIYLRVLTYLPRRPLITSYLFVFILSTWANCLFTLVSHSLKYLIRTNYCRKSIHKEKIKEKKNNQSARPK